MIPDAASEDRPVALRVGASTAAIELDTSLYEEDAIFRACYKLTDRCHFFLAHASAGLLAVTIMAKRAGADLGSLVGDLYDELIDQQIRLTLSREAGPIRELIVAQAFAEGNLLDPRRDDGDYENDPLGIGAGR